MKYLDNMTGNKDDFTRLFNVSSNQTHPLKKEFKIQIQLYEPYALNGEQEFKEVSSMIGGGEGW